MTRMGRVFLVLMFAIAGFGQSLPQGRLGGLTELIERKPDYANAYFARGTIYLQGLLFTDAVKDLTKVIALRPDDAKAYAKRAEAFAGLSTRRRRLRTWAGRLAGSPETSTIVCGAPKVTALSVNAS